MATLLFQHVGQSLGSSLIGGALGSALGSAAGALLGAAIDSALFSPTQKQEGPRVSDLPITGIAPGQAIPKIWGRARVPGHLIWIGDFSEEHTSQTQRVGGKGFFGGSKVTTETYNGFLHFAVALAEGPLGHLDKVFVDGEELDLQTVVMRYYPGSEDQEPDSLLIAQEGQDRAPAFRGVAYVVFEHFCLTPFGNRLPTFSFDVFRPLSRSAAALRSVNIIPGSTEFGYDPDPVTHLIAPGISEPENQHASPSQTNWHVAMDHLQAQCPNLDHVSLICGWFGTDLRCGKTQIKPGVERRNKRTSPHGWKTGGVDRNGAHLISTRQDTPAYGGTPNDGSVIRALKDLKKRGLAITFYPFLFLDIPENNTLPNPYGAPGQPAYPWRGDITLEIAPGRAGSSDGTAAAQGEVQAFFGRARATEFTQDGSSQTVRYHGPDGWTYRRMVLHYAHLCALAGGVDAFLIGSELKNLTRVRSGLATYPAVLELISLAEEVKTILPNTKLSYAADWSEYPAHTPPDRPGDLTFHLDPLWASQAIDFIGIDCYFPLSDWRQDPEGGPNAMIEELMAGMKSGEYYDWYYASSDDRNAQRRTPITDGAYQKPWVYRTKDLKSFWQNRHYNRTSGQENASPTPWIPGSKPIWLTEIGCPAINKGTNQPNVFYDPKSSASAWPYFSDGTRDDGIQRCFLEAVHRFWQTPDNNPPSPLTGLPMVDPARLSVWAYDARPYPTFPARADLWADTPHYGGGHWINGRLAPLDLAEFVKDICRQYQVPLAPSVWRHTQTGGRQVPNPDLQGVLDGYLVDRPTSARACLEQLGMLYGFSILDTPDGLAFTHRASSLPALPYTEENCLDLGGSTPLWSVTKTDPGDLPKRLRTTVLDPDAQFRLTVVEAQKPDQMGLEDQALPTGCILQEATAQKLTENTLFSIWESTLTLTCTLPPSEIALEVGDLIHFSTPSFSEIFEIQETTDWAPKEITAVRVTPQKPLSLPRELPPPPRITPVVYGPCEGVILDLPMVRTGTDPTMLLAGHATPWPGALALYGMPSTDTLPRLITTCQEPATLGVLRTPLPQGPLHVTDQTTTFEVELFSGTLTSLDRLAWLEGGNLACIGTPETGFEILSFQNATYIAPQTYRLTTLLRGQWGSASALHTVRPEGERFILLNAALTPIPTTQSPGTPWIYALGPSQRDPRDPTYLSLPHTFHSLAARPYPPVHGKIHRAQNGDYLVSWIRQTRYADTPFEAFEVPLGEAFELYHITIGDGQNTLRTLESPTPSLTYTQAMAQQDFAENTPSFVVSISQISERYGPGEALILHYTPTP